MAWEPLPPCSDCADLTAALNRRMPQLEQRLSAPSQYVTILSTDGNTEKMGVDGWAAGTGFDAVWATVRNANGNDSDDSDVVMTIDFQCTATTNQFNRIYRAFTHFRMQDQIPTNAVIQSAYMDFQVVTKKPVASKIEIFTSPRATTTVASGSRTCTARPRT